MASNAEARLRVETVARAALEAELDRAREGGAATGAVIAERDELAAALAAERLAREAERDALVVERDQRPACRVPRGAGAERELRSSLDGARGRRAAAPRAACGPQAELEGGARGAC